MNISTMFFIAVGLSMDAMAVSIANGVIIKKDRALHALRFAFAFGFFQMLMPVIGWFGGSYFSKAISGLDHWVAFALLAVIGGKMIYESTIIESLEKEVRPMSSLVLLGLAVATSIDALAVGVSFAFLDVTIMMPVIIIGAVTFLISMAGFLVGEKIGRVFEKKAEFLGGAILVVIGIKILMEHLCG